MRAGKVNRRHVSTLLLALAILATSLAFLQGSEPTVARMEPSPSGNAPTGGSLSIAREDSPTAPIWPMVGGNTRHTGLSPYDTSENKGGIKWSFQTNATATSVSIGADGTLYFGGTKYLYAVHPNGTMRWKFEAQDTISTTPAIDSNGVVYFAGAWFYSVLPNGTLNWRYGTSGAIFSSPVIGEDGTIYFGSAGRPDSKNGGLFAINPDGTLKWSLYTGAGVYSSPAIGQDGTIYVTNVENTVFAVRDDGTVKWRYMLGEIDSETHDVPNPPPFEGASTVYAFNSTIEIFCSPVIGPDGTIYFGPADWFSYLAPVYPGLHHPDRDHNLYALNPNGTLKWKLPTAGFVVSSPAIGGDGTIYAVSFEDLFDTQNPNPGDAMDSRQYLYAIDSDGRLKWKFPTEGFLSSSPTVDANGIIYFYGGHRLNAVNPDGTCRWSFRNNAEQFHLDAPVIDPSGTVYFGFGGGFIDRRGGLFAFDKGKPSSPENAVLREGHDNRLSWSPPSTDGGGEITQYRIYRGVIHLGDPSWDEPVVYHATVYGSSLTFTDPNTTDDPTIKFYYYVTAVNAYGEWPRSVRMSVTYYGDDLAIAAIVIAPMTAATTVLYLVFRRRK